MTGAEAHKLTDEEIRVEVRRLRDRLHTLRTQAVTEKVEDNSQYGKTRKDIARLMTVSRMRELETN